MRANLWSLQCSVWAAETTRRVNDQLLHVLAVGGSLTLPELLWMLLCPISNVLSVAYILFKNNKLAFWYYRGAEFDTLKRVS